MFEDLTVPHSMGLGDWGEGGYLRAVSILRGQVGNFQKIAQHIDKVEKGSPKYTSRPGLSHLTSIAESPYCQGSTKLCYFLSKQKKRVRI
jgi:hypothetical protein